MPIQDRVAVWGGNYDADGAARHGDGPVKDLVVVYADRVSDVLDNTSPSILAENPPGSNLPTVVVLPKAVLPKTSKASFAMAGVALAAPGDDATPSFASLVLP